MASPSHHPWRQSNQSSSTEDEDEVYPRIDEEIFRQLPERLRRNLRSLQQEAYDRLSRPNLNLDYHTQNHHHPQSQQQRATQSTSSQANSNTFPPYHQTRDNWPLLTMDGGSSKYLSIRNPEPRGSRSTLRRGGDEGEAAKKKVQFNLPELENGEMGHHGHAGEQGPGLHQEPARDEHFGEYPEHHHHPALEFTSPWTTTARYRNIISGERSNPHAPYTSASREQIRRLALSEGIEEANAFRLGRNRQHWLKRFLGFLGFKGRKDRKP
ncbi:hypothetical protein FQN54_001716 [Arachnomyces sp. PD_36]|nr:hypothetical protein FQN54_001716 [Arachnomyces sp. PD_36]